MSLIQRLKNEHIGYASAIIAAILFGSVSTITKPVLEDLNAFSVSSLTYIIAGLSLVPFLKFSSTNSNSNNNTLEPINNNSNKKRNWTDNNNNKKKNYFLLLLTSLCGAVIAPTLFFSGLSNTSASDSSILINGEVFFSILLAIVFFNEKLIRREIVALILVLVGIVILTTNMEFLSSNSFIELSIGNILVVGSTLFWALDNNISKILSKTIHIPKIIVLKTLIGGSILFILFIIIFGINDFINTITIFHIPYLVFAGSMGFGASLFFFLNSLKRIGTIKTILLFSTSSIFGMIFAKIFLNENITIYQIIAVGVILSGCYLIKR
jgi:drug/metabolite transporter (DMT)-like permease